MASRLQDVILRGLAASRPLATAVAPGTLYFSTDTSTTSQSDGTTWASYADAGGVPGLHAPTHSAGGTDPVTVTNLDGYPGGTTTFLRADHTFATPPAAGITQLTGDVTAGPGSGSQAATLANTAVTPGSYTLASLTVDAKGRLTAASSGTAGAPAAHATTHSSGGSDPVTVTNLAGYPGGTTTYLRADGTFGTPAGTGAGTVTHTAGALTANQLVVGNASADVKVTAATDGQIPIGKSSDGSVTLATLTAGNNITITNAAGAVTIASPRTGVIGFIIDGGGSAITTGVKGDLEVPFACTITAATLLADVSGSVVIDIWKRAYASYPPTVAQTITASAKPTISSAVKAQDLALTGWTTAITAGDTLRFNVDSVSTITRLTVSLKITVP